MNSDVFGFHPSTMPAVGGTPKSKLVSIRRISYSSNLHSLQWTAMVVQAQPHRYRSRSSSRRGALEGIDTVRRRTAADQGKTRRLRVDEEDPSLALHRTLPARTRRHRTLRDNSNNNSNSSRLTMAAACTTRPSSPPSTPSPPRTT